MYDIHVTHKNGGLTIFGASDSDLERKRELLKSQYPNAEIEVIPRISIEEIINLNRLNLNNNQNGKRKSL